MSAAGKVAPELDGVTFADAVASFNPDALADGVELSDAAAKLAALLMALKLRAANGPQEQAVAVAELERLAPKLKPNVVRWTVELNRSRRMRLAGVVHRLLGRPLTRGRGRRDRRATLRRSPARSPGRLDPDRPAKPLEFEAAV